MRRASRYRSDGEADVSAEQPLHTSADRRTLLTGQRDVLTPRLEDAYSRRRGQASYLSPATRATA